MCSTYTVIYIILQCLELVHEFLTVVQLVEHIFVVVEHIFAVQLQNEADDCQIFVLNKEVI